MAAVAAEADGAPLWGQVVGQPEPGPLMDERVLRRLCGMLDVPAAGSLADQAAACRAALLGGEPEPAAVAPRGQEMERAYDGTERGSIESLGRWNEKRDDPAMPIKFKAEDPLLDKCNADRNRETMVRVGFGKFVDELVQTKGASSGILAISTWEEMRGPFNVTFSEVSWSASPDDTSYRRHGAPDEAARLRAEAKRKGKGPLEIRFADFEGVVHDIGDKEQMAVYRVTLPSGGLDADKWAGRPPPPAPEDLYTGPRRDGLLSTEEISGDYRCGYFPFFGHSMTVVPHGPDMIETWSTCCFFLLGPMATGAVRPRDPGTNAFRDPQSQDPNKIVTFSADGTAKQGCGDYKKRPGSQKRTFQKVDARDLAGKWWSCCCIPLGPPCLLLSTIYPVYCTARRANCTAKTALNEDQYEESGRCCVLDLSDESRTHTRLYVNGHATNAFAGSSHPFAVLWHRDPGLLWQPPFIFAKKVG